MWETLIYGSGLLSFCVFWFLVKREDSRNLIEGHFYLVSEKWDGTEEVRSGRKKVLLDFVEKNTDSDYAQFTLYSAERYDAIIEQHAKGKPVWGANE